MSRPGTPVADADLPSLLPDDPDNVIGAQVKGIAGAWTARCIGRPFRTPAARRDRISNHEIFKSSTITASWNLEVMEGEDREVSRVQSGFIENELFYGGVELVALQEVSFASQLPAESGEIGREIKPTEAGNLVTLWNTAKLYRLSDAEAMRNPTGVPADITRDIGNSGQITFFKRVADDGDAASARTICHVNLGITGGDTARIAAAVARLKQSLPRDVSLVVQGDFFNSVTRFSEQVQAGAATMRPTYSQYSTAIFVRRDVASYPTGTDAYGRHPDGESSVDGALLDENFINLARAVHERRLAIRAAVPPLPLPVPAESDPTDRNIRHRAQMTRPMAPLRLGLGAGFFVGDVPDSPPFGAAAPGFVGDDGPSHLDLSATGGSPIPPRRLFAGWGDDGGVGGLDDHPIFHHSANPHFLPIINHIRGRFVQLRQQLAENPSLRVVIAGDQSASARRVGEMTASGYQGARGHFLGVGLARGQWANDADWLAMLQQIDGLVDELFVQFPGQVSCGIVGAAVDGPDKMGPNCLHVWGANAENWNLPTGAPIPGEQQAKAMRIQVDGSFGIVTTPHNRSVDIEPEKWRVGGTAVAGSSGMGVPHRRRTRRGRGVTDLMPPVDEAALVGGVEADAVEQRMRAVALELLRERYDEFRERQGAQVTEIRGFCTNQFPVVILPTTIDGRAPAVNDGLGAYFALMGSHAAPENKEIYVVTNHGNAHWDSTKIDPRQPTSEHWQTDRNTGGGDQACGAYTLVGILAKSPAIRGQINEKLQRIYVSMDNEADRPARDAILQSFADPAGHPPSALSPAHVRRFFALALTADDNVVAPAVMARVTTSNSLIEIGDIHIAFNNLGVQCCDQRSMTNTEGVSSFNEYARSRVMADGGLLTRPESTDNVDLLRSYAQKLGMTYEGLTTDWGRIVRVFQSICPEPAPRGRRGLRGLQPAPDHSDFDDDHLSSTRQYLPHYAPAVAASSPGVRDPKGDEVYNFSLNRKVEFLPKIERGVVVPNEGSVVIKNLRKKDSGDEKPAEYSETISSSNPLIDFREAASGKVKVKTEDFRKMAMEYYAKDNPKANKEKIRAKYGIDIGDAPATAVTHIREVMQLMRHLDRQSHR